MLIKVKLDVYEKLSEGDGVAPVEVPERVGHFIFDPTLVVTEEDEEVLIGTFLELLTKLCSG